MYLCCTTVRDGQCDRMAYTLVYILNVINHLHVLLCQAISYSPKSFAGQVGKEFANNLTPKPSEMRRILTANVVATRFSKRHQKRMEERGTADKP